MSDGRPRPGSGRASAAWPGSWVACSAWGGGNVILPGLTWLGLEPKVAAGTTALAVFFSSLSGFAGHATLGGLDPRFTLSMAALAAAGSLVGSHVMKTRLTGPQLKRIIGVLLWVIAVKMALDLL